MPVLRLGASGGSVLVAAPATTPSVKDRYPSPQSPSQRHASCGPTITIRRPRNVGLDTQYQYINDKNAFSARASYIHENQNLSASSTLFSANLSNYLDSFKASATYTYDHT